MATTPTPAKAAPAASSPVSASPPPADPPAPPPPENNASVQASGTPEEITIGDKVLMSSAVGRLIHPYQIPLEFNPGVAVPVVVDEWVIGQFKAGKLQLA